MRHIIPAFLLVASLVAPARADETAIQNVITSQIEAFKVDDFATAFTFASPTIQSVFGNPENFGIMVRQGYPMVWRPAEVQFLTIDIIDGQLWQNVLIRDREGQVHILEYQMIPGENGWRINAVRLRKDTEGTA